MKSGAAIAREQQYFDASSVWYFPSANRSIHIGTVEILRPYISDTTKSKKEEGRRGDCPLMCHMVIGCWHALSKRVYLFFIRILYSDPDSNDRQETLQWEEAFGMARITWCSSFLLIDSHAEIQNSPPRVSPHFAHSLVFLTDEKALRGERDPCRPSITSWEKAIRLCIFA